ncbi:MAG: tRNA lysidine(34) synthetase TilS, partial [Methylococcales bacterium]|nr:tRNA lysidine(34) synthetase TilS [Methylococcales bacterium]
MHLSSKILNHLHHASHIYIAYSGGLDSHVLVHYCALNSRINTKLSAVYVNHGLQKNADDWESHCKHQASLLNIGFQALAVNINQHKKSPEEAAREARYHVLKTLLKKDDLLLVAQHREDQLETVLLQLFRGAGVQGLSAMAEMSPFGKGTLLRPLLACSQQALKDYATEKSLCWVEDPSNQCNDFRRNFLRNQIIPQLKTQWGNLDKTVARSAQHCRHAHVLLQKLGGNALQSCLNADNSLSIDALLNIDDAQQTLVIREWFARLQLNMPSVTFIQQLFETVIKAQKKANPILNYQQGCIRRYQHTLYYLKSNDAVYRAKIWSNNQQSLQLSASSALQKIT